MITPSQSQPRVLVYHLGCMAWLDALKLKLILNHIYGTDIDVPHPDTPEQHWERDVVIAEINYRYEEYRGLFQEAISWLSEMEVDFNHVELHYRDGFIILEECDDVSSHLKHRAVE